jgi:hypothetical protein
LGLLLDWTMHNNPETESSTLAGKGISVFMPIPLEIAVPFAHKKIHFRLRSAKFCFYFRISILFPFFRGKNGKLQLHFFHPYDR